MDALKTNEYYFIKKTLGREMPFMAPMGEGGHAHMGRQKRRTACADIWTTLILDLLQVSDSLFVTFHSIVSNIVRPAERADGGCTFPLAPSSKGASKAMKVLKRS